MSSKTNIDLIIINTKIYDPIKGLLPETALAISASNIVFLGDDQSARTLCQPATPILDAGGHLLLPAFTDSHTHFLGFVRRQGELNLENCHSLAEALRLISDKT